MLGILTLTLYLQKLGERENIFNFCNSANLQYLSLSEAGPGRPPYTSSPAATESPSPGLINALTLHAIRQP